ncbi:MAG: helix-turn-helix transcriptional regulator [Ignavibacteriales bacterium]|nr:helix-turn-helix transcriptional regulator [Ignavibacteriales bacterium]
MLVFNLNSIFQARGITNPAGFLRKNGFSYDSALRFSSAQMVKPSLVLIERLCIVLNCTPNDILEWKPDEGVNYKDNLAIAGLKKEKKEYTLMKKLKDLPLDKIDAIEKMISEIKED